MTQAARRVSIDPPLFDTVVGAVVFAFNFSSRSPKSALLKIMEDAGAIAVSRSIRPGSGLFGMDGVAQAGMLQQEIAKLPRISSLVLRLQFGICERINPFTKQIDVATEWEYATIELAHDARLNVFGGPVWSPHVLQDMVRYSFAVQNIARRYARLTGENPRTIERSVYATKRAINELLDTALNEAEARLKMSNLVR